MITTGGPLGPELLELTPISRDPSCVE